MATLERTLGIKPDIKLKELVKRFPNDFRRMILDIENIPREELVSLLKGEKPKVNRNLGPKERYDHHLDRRIFYKKWSKMMDLSFKEAVMNVVKKTRGAAPWDRHGMSHSIRTTPKRLLKAYMNLPADSQDLFRAAGAATTTKKMVFGDLPNKNAAFSSLRKGQLGKALELLVERSPDPEIKRVGRLARAAIINRLWSLSSVPTHVAETEKPLWKINKVDVWELGSRLEDTNLVTNLHLIQREMVKNGVSVEDIMRRLGPDGRDMLNRYATKSRMLDYDQLKGTLETISDPVFKGKLPKFIGFGIDMGPDDMRNFHEFIDTTSKTAGIPDPQFYSSRRGNTTEYNFPINTGQSRKAARSKWAPANLDSMIDDLQRVGKLTAEEIAFVMEKNFNEVLARHYSNIPHGSVDTGAMRTMAILRGISLERAKEILKVGEKYNIPERIENLTSQPETQRAVRALKNTRGKASTEITKEALAVGNKKAIFKAAWRGPLGIMFGIGMGGLIFKHLSDVWEDENLSGAQKSLEVAKVFDPSWVGIEAIDQAIKDPDLPQTLTERAEALLGPDPPPPFEGMSSEDMQKMVEWSEQSAEEHPWIRKYGRMPKSYESLEVAEPRFGIDEPEDPDKVIPLPVKPRTEPTKEPTGPPAPVIPLYPKEEPEPIPHRPEKERPYVAPPERATPIPFPSYPDEMPLKERWYPDKIDPGLERDPLEVPERPKYTEKDPLDFSWDMDDVPWIFRREGE